MTELGQELRDVSATDSERSERGDEVDTTTAPARYAGARRRRSGVFNARKRKSLRALARNAGVQIPVGAAAVQAQAVVPAGAESPEGA